MLPKKESRKKTRIDRGTRKDAKGKVDFGV
jgi:hypothetical protein